MRLQSIHIKGFKSFADELQLDLKQAITGIIGPNGAGKSNLVDALRWALGEQRSTWLRSEHMQDLIFNGTQQRKALHMAEVSLLLDNTKHALATDYTQVTLSRRIYRNGENEYAINGVRSRRKDLTGILLDSGLQAEAYSIIELKMIDRLLHNTDDARRLLFEQAAGITSFKNRKKETLTRLKDTAEHMNRLEDLLHEIKDNLHRLQKQAEQAKKYSLLKENYKNLRCHLSEKQQHTLDEQEKNLRKQLQQESKRQHNHTQQQTQYRARLQKQKLESLEKEKLCQKLQKDIYTQESRIQQAEHQQTLEQERLKTLKQQQENFENTQQQYLEKKEKNHIQIQALEVEKVEESAKKTHLLQKVAQCLEAHEQASTAFNSCQHEHQAQTQLLEKARETQHQAQKSLELAQARTRWLEKQSQEYRQEQTQHQQELQAYQKEYQALKITHSAQQKKLHQQQTTTQKSCQAYDDALESLREQEKEWQKIQQGIENARNEQDFLQALHTELEGSSEAIRFLRKNPAWNVKAPLLLELISCPSDYRVVVESYLEPYAHYYVVADEQKAEAAITLLRESQKGRAHFFVLSRLPEELNTPTSSVSQDPSDSSSHQALLPHLKAPMRYKKLIQYLFADVYVTEDLKICQPTQSPVKTWIHKEHASVYRSYTLSGGSPPREENSHMERTKRLTKLHEQIQRLESQSHQQKKTLQKQQIRCEETQQLRHKQEENLQKIQQAYQGLEQAYTQTQNLCQQAQESLSADAKKHKTHQEEYQHSLGEVEQALRTQQDYEIQVQQEEKKLKALNKSYQRFQKDLQSQQTQVHTQESKLQKQQHRIEQLDAHIAFYQQQHAQELKSAQEQDQTQQEITQKIRDMQQALPEQKTQNAKHYAEKTRLEKVLHQTEEDYYRTRGDIEKLEKEGEALYAQTENSKVLHTELEAKIQQLSLERDHLHEQLRTAFGENTTCTQTDNTWHTQDEEILQNKVQRMATRLESMGEINMLAIENYEAMQERYRFICKEKEDVLNARASLEETMSKIEETVQTQFMAAFESTRNHFKELFGTIFGEESACDLKLSEPKNPLETRIVIMAKPKGKQLRSIEQLSSGERTLTALCLLFAVYAYKPSPFCVLDEVDAPLDDANIEKFNHLIKSLSNKAQFLIITHNKLTMQHTETIYGLAMIEGGVSKILPVDWSVLKAQN